ncbi:MAG TPA: DUF4394 domain-containing protein, partial [Blastocatellia bacterium]|nr:DUF4394 domain-containing protein [Blastocatellia bacterium]
MPQGNRRSRFKRGLSLALALASLFSTLALPSPGLMEAQGQGFRLPSSCSSDSPVEGTIYAVTVNNNLLSFNPGAPGVILSQRFISGLAQGETVVGMDFRPATGQLYAISSASRVHVINPVSGLATPVGTAAFSPGLTGQSFGVDFNPVPDLIRVLSDADQN